MVDHVWWYTVPDERIRRIRFWSGINSYWATYDVIWTTNLCRITYQMPRYDASGENVLEPFEVFNLFSGFVWNIWFCVVYSYSYEPFSHLILSTYSNMYSICKCSSMKLFGTSKKILAHSQQLKHWNQVRNLFKDNNKEIRTFVLMHL